MKAIMVALAFALAAATSAVSAQPVRWTRYAIPQTATSVDFPSSIFTEEAGRHDGYGQRFAPQTATPNSPSRPRQTSRTIHPPYFSVLRFRRLWLSRRDCWAFKSVLAPIHSCSQTNFSDLPHWSHRKTMNSGLSSRASRPATRISLLQVGQTGSSPVSSG
jgi:hypothetical protein